MWTKLLIKNMCILFLFSTTVLAAIDMVDGHHRRLFQDSDDVYEEDHHFHIFDIFKRIDILIYGTLSVVFLVIVNFFLFLFLYMRSSKKASSQSEQ